MARSADIGELAAGVRAADRSALGRAVTLVESTRAQDRSAAAELLERLRPDATRADAQRVGISGVPGVGKSTFIEALGLRLTAQGQRVAVLAVDPTSARSGGSILGDKTRMTALANDPAAFVRPSPSLGELGGVTAATRDAITLCEAAGFGIVLVETVGVGQSEIAVAAMVDCFVVLMLPGAGDDLQGIKKGILEAADLIAVNKADGANAVPAAAAARDYALALHMTEPVSPTWQPPVMTCSALNGSGLDELWASVERHRACMTASGERAAKRAQQRVGALHALLDYRRRAELDSHDSVRAALTRAEHEVRADRLTPGTAVQQVLDAFARAVVRTSQKSSSKAISPSMPT